MYIIYCSICIFSYWITKELIGSFGMKKKSLPNFEKSLSICIGESEHGKIYHNFVKRPHLIVCGTIGYGKTNFIKCMTTQVKGEIIIIDLKGGFDYDKVSATTIEEAEEQLSYAVSKLKQLNKEHTFVIIDEAGELLPPDWASKEEKVPYLKCLRYCSEIARLGRSFNLHLIYCTQYPTSDIMSRQIKQTAESRLCFRLPTEIASRVALDESGAEELPTGDYGLGIYKTDRKAIVRTYLYEKHAGVEMDIRETIKHTGRMSHNEKIENTQEQTTTDSFRIN